MYVLSEQYHVENGSHDPMEILLWSEQDDDVVDRLEHIPSFQVSWCDVEWTGVL